MGRCGRPTLYHTDEERKLRNKEGRYSLIPKEVLTDEESTIGVQETSRWPHPTTRTASTSAAFRKVTAWTSCRRARTMQGLAYRLYFFYREGNTHRQDTRPFVTSMYPIIVVGFNHPYDTGSPTSTLSTEDIDLLFAGFSAEFDTSQPVGHEMNQF